MFLFYRVLFRMLLLFAVLVLVGVAFSCDFCVCLGYVCVLSYAFCVVSQCQLAIARDCMFV